MACGAEMTLIDVVRDETIAIDGFQRHSFLCPSCNDVEHRLIFAKPGDETGGRAKGAPLAAHPAPPISPTADGRGESGPPAGLLRRVLGRLRGG
jgi:hypothetical protein